MVKFGVTHELDNHGYVQEMVETLLMPSWFSEQGKVAQRVRFVHQLRVRCASVLLTTGRNLSSGYKANEELLWFCVDD